MSQQRSLLMTVLHNVSHSETYPTTRLSETPSTMSMKDIKVLKANMYGTANKTTTLESKKQDAKNIRKLKKTIKRTGLVLARHAEENVLARYNKLLEKVDAKSYKKRKLCLLVIRINAQGELTESKPCSHCVEVLKEYGIRKVSYSTKEGIIVSESLETMITSPSVGYRSVERALAMLDEMLDLYTK